MIFCSDIWQVWYACNQIVKIIFCVRNNVAVLEVEKQGPFDRKLNVTATMFPELCKQGNIVWKRNVSSTMFPEASKHGYIDRKHNASSTMIPEVCKQRKH